MIFEIGLTLASGVAAAALVPKASRLFLLGDIKQDWLGHELEFDFLHSDQKTVVLKNGQFMRCYKIRGRSYETMSFDEEIVLAKRRASFLHQNFGYGTNIRFFGIKRQKDISFQTEWPSITLAKIGAAEQKHFKKAFSIYWNVVVTAKNFTALDKVHKSLNASFADYKINAIEAAEIDYEPCELTSFLNYLISGDLRFDVPRLSQNLSAALPGSDLHIDTSGLIETHTPHYKCHRVIAVKAWPEAVAGFLVSKLLALNGELEIMQSCQTLHNETAIAAYTRKIREQQNNIFGNATVIGELEAIKEELANNATTLFETQFQILVSARHEKDLDALIDQVEVILNQDRIAYSLDTLGASICWFNRFSERSRLLRPLRLQNANLAALWPFQASPEGLPSSPFGPLPIRQFKTPTGQNYYFQFHVSDKPQSAGNYLVIAPTGTGKSTLILHLLGGVAKFANVPSYVFDSKNGAQFMIEALGGVYQGFDQLALNPLDTDLTSESGMHRAHMIMRALAGDAYKESLDKEIKLVLEMASRLECPERTLNKIYNTAFTDRSDLKRAFAKWVVDGRGSAGQYSHIFNAPHDKIKGFLGQSFLTGINMNEALEDPVLGPAVIAHISAAITEAARASNNGFTIFVDEAANLLRNNGFRKVVLEMFREYRKLDGLVGLAFQDPEALLKFEGHEGIIKNCQTFLFMPNSQATAESLAPFNLTNDQVNFIRGENQFAGGRQVLVVKRDLASGFDESAIIDVDLSHLDDCMRFYRAGTSANTHLAAIKAQWGDLWLNHI